VIEVLVASANALSMLLWDRCLNSRLPTSLGGSRRTG
jgi:hypothetical protein